MEVNMPDPQELVELLVDGARYGDVEDVDTALQHNVDINGKDEGGRTGASFSTRASCPSHLSLLVLLLHNAALFVDTVQTTTLFLLHQMAYDDIDCFIELISCAHALPLAAKQPNCRQPSPTPCPHPCPQPCTWPAPTVT